METGQLSVSLRVLSVSVLSFRLGRSHHGVTEYTEKKGRFQ